MALTNTVPTGGARMRVLELPAELCTAAEERFGDRFKTVPDLLVFILNELLRGRALQLDESEQDAIEERLRELGYI